MFSLGLEDRDRIAAEFGGGIPKGGIVVIQGENATGKSVWSQRFAYGICADGNTVSYVSVEDNSRSFINQMDSMKYDVTEMLVQQQMLFINADTDVNRHIGGGDVEFSRDGSLMEQLVNADQLWSSDFVVLDNFTDLLLKDDKFSALMEEGRENEAMKDLASWFQVLANEGKTILVCADTSKAEESLFNPLLGMATVHLETAVDETGGKINRSITVRQFKNMDGDVSDKINFGIQAGQGVIIETRTIA